jgi:hypothetical protein
MMNLWFYTLLIVALVVLLGATLYARFAPRSRSKSLHHAPVRVRFPAAVISAAPLDEESDLDFGQIFRHAIDLEEEPLAAPLPAIPSQPEDRVATEYLDELQEAAAGLALLMRSTAPWKAEPVVYAPDDAEFPAEEVGTLDGVVSESEEPVQVPAPAQGIINTSPIAPKRDLHLLGELVCQQFVQIDEGLDDLEALISSIELSLSAWSETPSVETGIDWEAAA